MALKNVVSIIMQGVDKFSEPSKQVKRELTGLEKASGFLKDKLIGPGGLVAAVGAAAIGIGAMVNATAGRQDQIGKFADRINVSTEFLSEMGVVADRAGVPVSQLQTGLQRLSRRAAEFATTGGGEAADTFRRLGIEVRNADGTIRTAESLLPELADKFAGLTDETEATALAFKLFDTEGVSFLQFLKQGSAGIAEIRREAKLFGLSVSQDAADGAAEFNDSMGRLKDSLTGLRDQLVSGALMDSLAEFVDLTASAVKNVNQLRSGVTGDILVDEDARLARIEELRTLMRGDGSGVSVGSGEVRIDGVTTEDLARYSDELERLLEIQARFKKDEVAAAVAGSDVGGFVGPRLGRGAGLRVFRPNPELQALETIDPFGEDTIDGATQFEERLGTISNLYVDLSDEATVHEEALRRIAYESQSLVDLANQRIQAEFEYGLALAGTNAAIGAISGPLTAFTDTIIEGGNAFKIQFGDVFQQVGRQALGTINQLIARMIVLRTVSLFDPTGGFLSGLLGFSTSRIRGDQARVIARGQAREGSASASGGGSAEDSEKVINAKYVIVNAAALVPGGKNVTQQSREVANQGLQRELDRARRIGGV